jgi:hypothetical protein
MVAGVGLHLDRSRDVPRGDSFRMLSQIGYDGPISVEWADAGMDRRAR